MHIHIYTYQRGGGGGHVNTQWMGAIYSTLMQYIGAQPTSHASRLAIYMYSSPAH